MMLAAVIKDYFATANGVSPRDVCSCSVMPCVRKQGEADRPWFETETPDDMGTVRDVNEPELSQRKMYVPGPVTVSPPTAWTRATQQRPWARGEVRGAGPRTSV